MTSGSQGSEDRFPELSSWFKEGIWRGHFNFHLEGIREHMEAILSAANLPIRACKPPNGHHLAYPELDQIVARCEGHSNDWLCVRGLC
jgi:hypothetical protein